MNQTKKYSPARLIIMVSMVNIVPVLILLIGINLSRSYQEQFIATALTLVEREAQIIFDNIKDNQTPNQNIVQHMIPNRTAFIMEYKNKHYSFGATHLLRNKFSALSQPEQFHNLALNSIFTIRFNLQNLPEVYDGRNNIFISNKKPIALKAWTNEKNHLLISAAVQKNARTLVYIKSLDEVAATLNALHQKSIQLFVLVLCVSLALSLFLTANLTYPLRQLLKASEAATTGQTNTLKIPDFSDRGDEIGELSKALIAMTDKLKTRMSYLEQFAADVAHELKNPLASLKSALETLTSLKRKSDKETLMAVMEDDLNRIDTLISDITDVSRLDTALSYLEKQPIEMNEFLLKVIDKTRSVHPDMAIHLQGLENEIFILGDETKLAQVIHNILDNAVSFSNSDNVINVTLEALKDRVKITIEDEGPGIKSQKINRIFERFYTNRTDMQMNGHHSGLGLSIAKKIVEAHTGTINARNITKNGKVKGARFTIYFDLKDKNDV